MLKSFNYDGRNVILDKYAKILARPDFLNEGLLRKFVENQDLVSDATVDRINESIASWMTTKTDYNVFLQILSLNSVTKKKFIKSQILQSVVSKIIPNNPTSAQSDTTVYLQYKDLSTPTVKSSFLDKMNNLLKTSESDDFLINRYNRPLNEFQGIAVSTLLQLAPEDIETGISNWIYDTVDTIKSNVDSIFTNRSPKPGNDFHIELIRVKLVLFNKLESTKQKATVTELKDLMEKTQRYQELIGYVKMHKSSILEYDEIFDSIMQSINLNPSDSSSFDFLIKYSSVERKEKIVQILKDWIPSRDPGELEGLLLSLKNNHAMIPNQGKAVLKEALKVVMDSPSSSGNLLLGEVIGML